MALGQGFFWLQLCLAETPDPCLMSWIRFSVRSRHQGEWEYLPVRQNDLLSPWAEQLRCSSLHPNHSSSHYTMASSLVSISYLGQGEEKSRSGMSSCYIVLTVSIHPLQLPLSICSTAFPVSAPSSSAGEFLKGL